MAREPVTLLWIVDGAPKPSATVREVADSETQVVEIVEIELEEGIAKARARGAVVCVGADARLAKMLKLGADEAASWTATPALLSEAVARARSRAEWRASTQRTDSVELAGLAFMSAAIGHEIRNPLAAAMINCSTVTTLVGPTEPQSDLHGALSDLNESLHSIAHVVRQMVALTDPGEAGACDFGRTLVELTTYVHKEVEFAADFDVDIPSEPCPVALSRTRALEVVASVLNNAIFAVERLTNRRARISLRLTLESESVVVDVTDNGVGMTPEVRKQALNPLFTTRRPGALGMGLTFAAMHVRRAGGELFIDSEVDEGTSVRMFLPRMNAPPLSQSPKN
jgi:C4-dicarboxylate-specific signal transduction histidine kinase